MPITECPGCGTQWSDGRSWCDHDRCGRARPVERWHRKPAQDCAGMGPLLAAIRPHHRQLIGMALRGDKELHAYQIDALVAHGYARRRGGSVVVDPEVEAAYRRHYLPQAPRIIVHRIAEARG